MFKYLCKDYTKEEKTFLHIIELFLAFVVIVGVGISFFNQIPTFFNLDWSLTSTFIEFMEVVLYLAVGVELARLLVSYNINTVIELLVFVIARKILLLEESALSLLLLVLATIILFAGRYFFMVKINKEKK